MRDLLLITAFVCFMAYMQYRQTNRIARYNNNLTAGALPKKQRRTWFYAAMLVMAVLVALRGEGIGNDTEEYRKIFMQVTTVDGYIKESRYEIGYLYLNKFVGLFTEDPQVLFALLAVFQYSVFTWFIVKYSDDLACSLVLFFLLVFGSTLNIVRQVTAMAFIMIGVDRVLNKHTIRAFVWLAIAVLFHTSAAILLVIPIIPYIRYKGIVAFIITVLVAVLTVTDILFIIFSKLFPDYAHYFSGQYADSGWLAIGYQLIRNFMFFAIGYFGVQRLKVDGNEPIYVNAKLSPDMQRNLSLWSMLFSFVIIIYGFRLNLIDRIVAYIVPFYVLLLPNTIRKMEKNMLIAFKALIILMLIAYSVIAQMYRPQWNMIYPYKFFWE